MKYLVTLIQVIFWLVMDITLFIYYLKWNMYKYRAGNYFKNVNGVVYYASNYDRNNGVKYFSNKYKAAFKL